MAPEADADMWASKLRDVSGEEPLQLRTTAPSQFVPGANSAVKIRTQAVEPGRIQYKADTGWEPVKKLLEARRGKSLPPNISEQQLKLLAAALGIKLYYDENGNPE